MKAIDQMKATAADQTEIDGQLMMMTVMTSATTNFFVVFFEGSRSNKLGEIP